MPDHTHQNLNNQFITLLDMKLHAQKQQKNQKKQFQKNHKGHYGARFKLKKPKRQWTTFFCKIQKNLSFSP